MRFVLLSTATALALAACAPSVPNDAGVGFDSYDENRRARVDSELATSLRPDVGMTQPAGNPPQSAGDASGQGGGDDIAAMAAAALDRDPDAPASGAGAAGAAPGAVTNSAGISNENNFDAVSSRRSIEEDAARVAQNTAQYQQIAPEPLPQRPSGQTANVVEYALTTTNQVGQPIYSRSPFASKAREQRNCTAYASADLAQEAFLESGGPERDREGLDADGDGFACGWSPAPFRRARG
ncbi:hypothetical protein ROJ8625_01177 [Roseivivax jejudonensis]|uniref:Excalibur calcium-binding domain-containing protein n=1 Tax=Roseivivax jejudonensis TaxID=1529041 RepID=A0A1X6YQY7_9RHOB|nr:hypothetical protein [Roseivivax jejudonensis]SLN28103.1 hypothetical protein ROJ8625_01177 [Roseivivax jejudonensis]